MSPNLPVYYRLPAPSALLVHTATRLTSRKPPRARRRALGADAARVVIRYTKLHFPKLQQRLVGPSSPPPARLRFGLDFVMSKSAPGWATPKRARAAGEASV
jgi:hypothetical protein